MSIINHLYDEFVELREKEIELENYGIKTIESFTMMRRYMVTIDEMFKQTFPSKWKKDINQFLNAKETYSSLKEDFIKFEDAEAYMDAVGHDFYVFLNGETGEVNVLYRRNDGNLGLIEVTK